MDNSPLKKLPAEVRNQIYDLVLIAPVEEKTDIRNWNEDTSLLRVCRQIRFEASGIYYSNTNFYYLVSSGNPVDGMPANWKILSDWIKLIGQENAGSIKNLEIDYGLSDEQAAIYIKCPTRINSYKPWIRQHSLDQFAPLTLDILLTLDELKVNGLVSAVITGTTYPTFVGRILQIIGQSYGPTAPAISRLAHTIEMWVEEEAALELALASPHQGDRKIRPMARQSMRPRLQQYWSEMLREQEREKMRARLLELAGVDL